MDLILSLAKFLQTKNVGVIGKTIFVNEMPETCNEGILLFSSLEGMVRHTEVAGLFRGSVMVATRARTAEAGCLLAAKASDALEVQGALVDGFTILASKPEAMPMCFGKSDGGHIEWLFSTQITATKTK